MFSKIFLLINIIEETAHFIYLLHLTGNKIIEPFGKSI